MSKIWKYVLRSILKPILAFTYENDFAKILKNLAIYIDIDLKIILFTYENNYVEYSN